MALSGLHPVNPFRGTAALDDLDELVEPWAVELAGLAAEDPRRTRVFERIVVSAVPLADGAAQRYRNRGIETDDLVQVARTALVKAVHRYRPGTGPGFSAFATPTITGELKRWFRDQGWAVRPPRRVQELRALLAAEEERLQHRLGRAPGNEELARALTVTAAEVAEVRLGAATYHATSLDDLASGGSSLADLLLVADCPSTVIATRDALRRSMALLPDRQRLVLRLRFVDELTQSQIGERIGVSQMQVSRILRDVLDRLRADLDDDPEPDVDDTAA